MLEEKSYPISEIRKILGTKNKQGIDRKLTGYGVIFDSVGRSENRVYNIKKITNPFKVYCITKLRIPAQANFEKIRNIFYCFLCSEDFADLPHIEQQRILIKEVDYSSRQCISRWIRFLSQIDYTHVDYSQCSYFAVVKKPNGSKECKTVTKEEYNEAWKIYWDSIDEGSSTAYRKMYQYLGGHPYKKFKTEYNVFYLKEIEELIEKINESFLSQTSDTI